MPVQCRIAPSLGALEGHPNGVWGTVPYTDDTKPCVFFGLYGLPDFYALWRHKGKKWVLWAGSDIRHFVKGYWLDDKGEIRMNPKPLAQWIDKHCESWVENEEERDELRKLGIYSRVCPSFLGNIDDYPVSYAWSDRPKVYASVSGDDFNLYNWPLIEMIAPDYPGIEFHLYGNTKEWRTAHPNVIVHGRIPKEQMNEEVKRMQGGFRPVFFEGFSEIVAKSLLWGQWPISYMNYPHTLAFDELHLLHEKKTPNVDGRSYYRETLNRYPWNTKV